MDSFRYAQFCPLARATEILGQRWTLLVVRELICGPQRFADLKRRLPGVSPSVLTERLDRLEQHGVVERCELGPPTPAKLYALTEHGEALRPILLDLTRWGLRWLLPAIEGDHMEPDWIKIGVEALASKVESPKRRLELVSTSAAGNSATVRLEGGERGTHIVSDALPVDLTIEAPPQTMMGLMSGLLPVPTAEEQGAKFSGDMSALEDLPRLFQFSLESGT
ncbi:MAG: helix-turn-helix domain-containing protein [Candidatus Binatia bacterium]|nr:helix-turn-helix domain-containing protein [Candidatus Binatia bacterium]